jgi:hypothetical protein
MISPFNGPNKLLLGIISWDWEPDVGGLRNVDISDITLYDADHANARKIYITGLGDKF